MTTQIGRATRFAVVLLCMACKGEKGDPGLQGETGPQGPAATVGTNAGLVGDGTSAAPLGVAFGGNGNATTVARSDHTHAPNTGANLLIDTTSFNWIPANQTNVTTNATYGPWYYFQYNASTASITVEAPPADLDAIVQGTTPWWPRSYSVLHLRISPGGANAGRFGQQLLPSEKTGPVTMSAYVKVLAGALSVGREFATQDFNNSAWQRVSVTNSTPDATLGPTLGGYWVFMASPTTFTEALIALPKVEQGSVASPWIEGRSDS